jgi:Protein of unknown function (DUF2924)
MSPGWFSGDIGRNHSHPMSSQSKSEMLDATVAGLSDLDADQLRLQWRNHLGGTAPAHLPRWLLLRVLAYRLQAATLGDHDKGDRARHSHSARRRDRFRQPSLQDAEPEDARRD